MVTSPSVQDIIFLIEDGAARGARGEVSQSPYCTQERAAAGELDKALTTKNGFTPFCIAIMVVGLLLKATFSTSLQAKFAVDAE